jgi:hypothetical protein
MDTCFNPDLVNPKFWWLGQKFVLMTPVSNFQILLLVKNHLEEILKLLIYQPCAIPVEEQSIGQSFSTLDIMGIIF